jgi:hypothetical protein
LVESGGSRPEWFLVCLNPQKIEAAVGFELTQTATTKVNRLSFQWGFLMGKTVDWKNLEARASYQTYGSLVGSSIGV